MTMFILAVVLILPAAGMAFEAGGLRLHLNCSGRGAPLIVLEAGLGDSSLVWSKVQACIRS